MEEPLSVMRVPFPFARNTRATRPPAARDCARHLWRRRSLPVPGTTARLGKTEEQTKKEAQRGRTI